MYGYVVLWVETNNLGELILTFNEEVLKQKLTLSAEQIEEPLPNILKYRYTVGGVFTTLSKAAEAACLNTDWSKDLHYLLKSKPFILKIAETWDDDGWTEIRQIELDKNYSIDAVAPSNLEDVLINAQTLTPKGIFETEEEAKKHEITINQYLEIVRT